MVKRLGPVKRGFVPRVVIYVPTTEVPRIDAAASRIYKTIGVRLTPDQLFLYLLNCYLKREENLENLDKLETTTWATKT